MKSFNEVVIPFPLKDYADLNKFKIVVDAKARINGSTFEPYAFNETKKNSEKDISKFKLGKTWSVLFEVTEFSDDMNENVIYVERDSTINLVDDQVSCDTIWMSFAIIGKLDKNIIYIRRVNCIRIKYKDDNDEDNNNDNSNKDDGSGDDDDDDDNKIEVGVNPPMKESELKNLNNMNVAEKIKYWSENFSYYIFKVNHNANYFNSVDKNLIKAHLKKPEKIRLNKKEALKNIPKEFSKSKNDVKQLLKLFTLNGEVVKNSNVYIKSEKVVELFYRLFKCLNLFQKNFSKYFEFYNNIFSGKKSKSSNNNTTLHLKNTGHNIKNGNNNNKKTSEEIDSSKKKKSIKFDTKQKHGNRKNHKIEKEQDINKEEEEDDEDDEDDNDNDNQHDINIQPCDYPEVLDKVCMDETYQENLSDPNQYKGIKTSSTLISTQDKRKNIEKQKQVQTQNQVKKENSVTIKKKLEAKEETLSNSIKEDNNTTTTTTTKRKLEKFEEPNPKKPKKDKNKNETKNKIEKENNNNSIEIITTDNNKENNHIKLEDCEDKSLNIKPFLIHSKDIEKIIFNNERVFKKQKYEPKLNFESISIAQIEDIVNNDENDINKYDRILLLNILVILLECFQISYYMKSYFDFKLGKSKEYLADGINNFNLDSLQNFKRANIILENYKNDLHKKKNICQLLLDNWDYLVNFSGNLLIKKINNQSTLKMMIKENDIQTYKQSIKENEHIIERTIMTYSIFKGSELYTTFFSKLNFNKNEEEEEEGEEEEEDEEDFLSKIF